MNDSTNTPAVTATQERARAKALGPIVGPCCTPAESDPCIACCPPDLHPDVVIYEPSPEDVADHREFCREFNARQRERQIDAGPTFQEKLDAFVSWLSDDIDNDLSGLGKWLAGLADEARACEAKSWTQFLDRRDAMIDARAAMLAR